MSFLTTETSSKVVILATERKLFVNGINVLFTMKSKCFGLCPSMEQCVFHKGTSILNEGK